MSQDVQWKGGRPATGPESPAKSAAADLQSAIAVDSERIVTPPVQGQELDMDEGAVLLLKGVVEPRKQAFLLALVQCGNRTRAARAVGISAQTVWAWNKVDPAFAKAFVRAMEMASDLMEDELYRRATEGVLEPVFQNGRLVGSVRRFSDHCLTLALKGAKPDKYADRQKVTMEVDVADRLMKARERALGRLPTETKEE